MVTGPSSMKLLPLPEDDGAKWRCGQMIGLRQKPYFVDCEEIAIGVVPDDVLDHLSVFSPETVKYMRNKMVCPRHLQEIDEEFCE